MDSASLQHLKTWTSYIKCGEVTQLLSDESAVRELKRGCDETLALKAFIVLASKIFELNTKPLEEIFPGATPIHLLDLSEIFSSLYVKNKTSDVRDEKFIISLHHVITYFLKRGYYEASLKLKGYVEEVSYGATSMKDEKQRTSIFHNLYLVFWNGSIELERKTGDSGLVLKLRLAAIDLLAHSALSKLQVVSERVVVTCRMYVVNKKDAISPEAVSNMCNDVLGIATPMVRNFLKLNLESESQGEAPELVDRLIVSVKSYSEILTEVMRVHNLFSRGKEGLELCLKYCKSCCGGGDLEKVFNGFLDILCDIFSRLAVTSPGEVIFRKNFHIVYNKLCEIQDLSGGHAKEKSEHVYCGIKFKSLTFLKASEWVCRSIIDLFESQSSDSSFGLSTEDESSLLLLLELGGKLNMVSNPAYSLKFMALSLKVVIHMLSNEAEEAGFGEYDHRVVKAKEILIFCVNVEEEINSFQSINSKSAVNAIIQVLHAAIHLFTKKKLLATCEEFLMKYNKLLSKWLEFPEFNVIKDNQWWSIKNLCICRRDQKKYRPALAALASVVECGITEKYSSVFNEWAKVKISALMSEEKTSELKLSTVYHILKENVRDQKWHFTNEELSRLLKMEFYAYMSKEAYLQEAIQDVCHQILEVSDDATLKAEAQLCLIELSCMKESADFAFGETVVDSGGMASKPDGVEESLLSALRSCQKLAADFRKEIKNASVPEDVPPMLCVLGQTYYWMYLCKSAINRKKAKSEISGDGSIPLRVPRKVDVNGQEEILKDGASSCDIVPFQLSLKSRKQKQLLNATLNVAVALWEHAIEEGMKNSHQGKFNVAVILKNIETSAYIYELYDDLWHGTKSWCLLCKYADIFMKDEMYLLGVSNLMRKGAVSLSNGCLLRVDNIVANLGQDSSLVLSYLLGKCWQYLYSSEFSVGLPILEKILKNCSQNMDRWRSILYAQAKYLLALYCLQSPQDVTGSELFKDPVFWGCTRYDFAISALSTLIRLLAGWQDSGSLSLYIFGQSLLLDIALWIGEVFLDLNIPREAYAYLKQQFLLAQKMLLPNRAVQFLSTLAFVDLMCCNTIDCEVKLLGIESIIDLDHEKDRDQPLGEIQNLIEWLSKGKGAIRRNNPNGFEILVFSDDGDEVRGGTKPKKEMGRYSPKGPGSRYKCIQLKKCTDKCFCEWCINSGFQKAFSGLRVVKVCMADKSETERSLPSTEIFENSNRILRGIISRFKMMISRMNESYFSLMHSEADQMVVQNLGDSYMFAVEISRLHVFYVRFMLNMIDACIQDWESSEAMRDDLINKSETLINVVEEETKDMKYLGGFQFLVHQINRLKLILGKAKVLAIVKYDESVDKYEEEFRLWEKSKVQAEVCKTPSKDVGSPPLPRKVKTPEGDGGDDGFYEPIPSVPKRNLTRRNLALGFKEEEEQSQKSRNKKVAPPGLKAKKVANSALTIGKLKKDTAGDSKVREVRKKNLDIDKVPKEIAFSVSKKGVAKSNTDGSSVCDTHPKRKPSRK